MAKQSTAMLVAKLLLAEFQKKQLSKQSAVVPFGYEKFWGQTYPVDALSGMVEFIFGLNINTRILNKVFFVYKN